MSRRTTGSIGLASAPQPTRAYARWVEVTRLVGIYRADGGLIGELRYLAGHYLRGRSCSLCDITHSPFRRKAAWDEEVASLGVPFDLVHLNEMDSSLAAFVDDRAACIVAETRTGWRLLVGDDELGSLDGSVGEFFRLLRSRLSSV